MCLEWRVDTGGGGGGILFEDVSLVEFLSFVFSRIPGKSYHRQLRFLLL